MSTADDQLAAFVDRILRMKAEAREINRDIRDIYAEAKANGFDKTVLGKLVNYVERREADGNAVNEAEALFDLYLGSYDRAKGRVGTPRATHTHAPDAGSSSGRTADFESADEGSNPSPATISVPGPAALDSYEAAAPSSDESAAPIPERLAAKRADPLRSGDAPRKDAYPAAPEPTRKFRPHCLHPDRCAGYGQNHCFSCQHAIGAAAA